MIPKLFHLTHKSHHLPSSVLPNVERIKFLYPDYEIHIYDDTDIDEFVRTNFKDYYEDLFIKLPQHIMRVDVVRIMLICFYGGVYCDTDIYFQKKIDFEHGAIFIERAWTYPENKKIINSVHNCIFASEPHHYIWKVLLDEIKKNFQRWNKKLFSRWFKSSKFNVFNLTGPNAISKIITEKKLLMELEDITVLPAKMLFQKSMSKTSSEDAFVWHQAHGTWR